VGAGDLVKHDEIGLVLVLNGGVGGDRIGPSLLGVEPVMVEALTVTSGSAGTAASRTGLGRLVKVPDW
jgi:hypothetical protein